MATPTCPKPGCGSIAFTAQPISIGAMPMPLAVCCMTCGVVVGVLSNNSSGDASRRLQDLDEKLDRILRQVR